MAPDPLVPPPAAVASPSIAELLTRAADLALSDAAQAYARAGMAVFPCTPDDKRPLTRHGLLDATTDGDQITRWWRRWPAANIGLPTGNQVEVVDVDRRPTGSGFVALERAQAAGLADGWVAIVRTPSHGIHLYHPSQPDRPQRSWAEPSVHLDFRGTGGYVIAPPSQVVTADGERRGYRVIAAGRDPRPVKAAALRSLLRAPRPRRPSPPPSARGVDGQRLADWVASRAEGNRNHALFWAACRCAERHLPEDHAQQLLGTAAEQAGLPEREIVATIRSAYRTAAPRPSPNPTRTAVQR